jgi:hypothetical protein
MEPPLLYALQFDCVGIVLRIALNGIDVVTEWEGARRFEIEDVNPFVIEGSNHLDVYLTPMTDDDGRVVGTEQRFRCTLTRLTRGRPLDEGERIASYDWTPAGCPVVPGTMTGVWSRQFIVRPEQAFGRWCWQELPTCPPGENDPLELVALAEIVHGALARKDLPAILRLTELRALEMAIAKGVRYDEYRAEQELIYKGWFGSPWWRLDPFDPNALAAVPYLRGRLVRVTDASGGAPIRGTDGVRRFTFPFMAARIEGSWTIVR